MNWLFYVILGFIILSVFLGGRRGFFKTAISMLFMILVLVLSSLLNPYVGRFMRENTPVYETIRARTEEVMMSHFEKEVAEELTEEEKGKLAELGISEDMIKAEMKKHDVPKDMQTQILEKLPLPNIFRESIIHNNKVGIYELLGVEKFADYVASYIAYSITNGIAFLLSFVLAIIIIKVVLYAINILTSIPGVSFLNSVGGMLLGGAQAILWVWVFFIVVTVLCSTAFGRTLMDAIEGDMLLNYLYEKNVFLPVIMQIMGRN